MKVKHSSSLQADTEAVCAVAVLKKRPQKRRTWFSLVVPMVNGVYKANIAATVEEYPSPSLTVWAPKISM